MKFFILLVLLIGVSLSLATDDYTGAQVYRVFAKTDEEFKSLQSLYQGGFADFWIEPNTKGPTDFLAQGYQVPVILEYMKGHNLKYEVFMSNVQGIIDEQKAEALSRGSKNMNWENYQRFDTISAWCDEIVGQHPDIASVQIIGKSHEGRDMRVVKIGYPGEGKPAIFIDAGIHAREWISPATITFIINELLTNSAAHEEVLRAVDFHIIPVTNPDGYEYTHTNDRLWRKTRKPNTGSSCVGTDPNRNFAIEHGGPGTSTNPCSEIYHGGAPFTEKETINMRDYIEGSGANWKLYVALHSYAQMFLTPWGYTYDLPEDYQKMKTLGQQAAAALQAIHNTAFRVGSVTELLSPGAGGSDDWAYGSGIFEYSYTLEIRDTGRYGFLLPPNQIIPSGEECLEAFKSFALGISKK